MNSVIKIIEEIIVVLNRLIDSLDKRTIEMIKQGYYLMVFVIIIVGIFIGYDCGKESAKTFGAPIAENTDDVFNDIVKTEREDVNFGSLIEGKSIREKEESILKKQAFPSNEKLEFETNHKIAEPDTEAKKIIAEPQSDIRERIADVKRLDETEPGEGLKELERRPLPDTAERESSIVKKAGGTLPEINKLEGRESS
ncbi:MAG: hypothetical protein MUC95_10235, partial [Spirochaetes bacterium]|nr:hypothetical protein [Spirochaetota bacterium]